MSRSGFNLTILGWCLAIPVLVLSGFSMASIHATDRSMAAPASAEVLDAIRPVEKNWADQAYAAVGELTLKQAFYFVTGVVLMFLTLIPSFRRIGQYTYWIYWSLIVLLIIVLAAKYGSRYGLKIPLIAPRNGSWRWIQMGTFSIQPSEFMKVAQILALAYYLRYRNSYRRWSGLIPPFLLTLLPMALILKQPDLGTVLMFLPVLFMMLFVAGARLRHLATIVLLAAAATPFFYFYGMESYQKERVEVLFKQNVADERWHLGPGYQLRQSLIALGTGGVTGDTDDEHAFIQYNLLPEEHNDFIFAVIGNQWGLTGCVVVILAYVIIIICGLEVAVVTNDPFGRLLAVGVVVMIAVQALLNMSMTLGLAPITGMTLPFVSAGGSSLWANFLALGLLVNVAQRRPMLIGHAPFEHEDE
jgi:rod shape determining protein RodA